MLHVKKIFGKALLINIRLFSYAYDYHLNELEFCELAKSGDMLVVASFVYKLNQTYLNPKYLIGQGKLYNILNKVKEEAIDLVIFNYELSASQQKNLEEFLNCKVLDRTELILHIFAKRAKTFEGKLQVELATLQHLSTRLVRVWTHLERQRGGVGLRGGPGEQQLEIDRRIIKNRIKSITKKLEKIQQQRHLHRSGRRKSRLLTVSLVGYTNSGKSTLFNRLTNANVTTLNMPFATLDLTVRSILIPKVGEVILTDTVGFIRDLPHHLIAAFKATLEEIVYSDLLLHVIDFSDNESIERRQHVLKVLEQIGASQVPILEVYNKIDQNLDMLKDGFSNYYGVKVSALYGLGMDELMNAISDALGIESMNFQLKLMPINANIRVEFKKLDAIKKEEID
ncbi:MAG: GTPase HflX, partial [Gammaproteobacteria bacterium]